MALFPNNLFKNQPSPTVKSNTPAVFTESRSLITRTRRLPGQRWEIDLNGFVFPNDNNAFMAFIFSLQGPTSTFEYPLISFGKSLADNKAAGEVGAIGDTTLELSNVNDVNIGEFLQFANHTKVYQVHGISGNEITIFPHLHSAVALGEVVNFNNVRFRMRLTENVQSFSAGSVRDKIIYSLPMVETI